jgi:hypothetical protein
MQPTDFQLDQPITSDQMVHMHGQMDVDNGHDEGDQDIVIAEAEE